MKTRTIDTNILIRVLAKDDSRQWQIATEIFNTSRVVILSTVLLETEWVLRKSMGLNSNQIGELFRAMLLSETIVFRERDRVLATLEAFDAGMDFADAFHICGAAEGETFITFDRNLVKRAKRHINTVSVELAS
jgi:predicted nucleic-acid-binding protein